MGTKHCKITNNTTNHMTHPDWADKAGHHHNFSGIFLGAKSPEGRREETTNQDSPGGFSMTFKFRDGTEDTFRINQKPAGEGARFEHATESHDIYYKLAASNILEVTIQNTQQQLHEDLTKKLNKEGEAAMRQKQYKAALRKFEEALRWASQSDTIYLIEANKAEAYYQLGQSLFQEGLDLDTSQDKSQEAKDKFSDAKLMFLGHITAQEESLKMVNLKVEGNRLFDEANKLENEAYKLFKEARDSGVVEKYNTSQNKYKEALSKYKEAKDKYDQGLTGNFAKFGLSSKIAGQSTEAVLKVIVDIDRITLKNSIK